MFRLLLFAGAACAVGVMCAPTLASAQDYNARASARAADTWGTDTSALVAQVPPSAAVDPYGPTLVTSRPVPDTPRNRARFGQPMSRAGRLTAPIGD